MTGEKFVLVGGARVAKPHMHSFVSPLSGRRVWVCGLLMSSPESEGEGATPQEAYRAWEAIMKETLRKWGAL